MSNSLINALTPPGCMALSLWHCLWSLSAAWSYQMPREHQTCDTKNLEQVHTGKPVVMFMNFAANSPKPECSSSSVKLRWTCNPSTVVGARRQQPLWHQLCVHISFGCIFTECRQETTGFSLAGRNACLCMHSWHSQASEISFVIPPGGLVGVCVEHCHARYCTSLDRVALLLPASLC